MNTTLGTPVRLRSWLGALLAALLLGSGLVAASPAQAAEASNVSSGEISWGYKASFRSYVGRQIAAMPPSTAMPVGQRITLSEGAQFDASSAPAAPGIDETRPYLFPVTGGSVTDEDNLTITGAGKASFHFPSHCFEAVIGNPQIVIAQGEASLRGDLSVTLANSNPGICDDRVPGTSGGSKLTLSAASHVTTIAPDGTSVTVTLTGLTMSAAGAAAMQDFVGAGAELDNLTLTAALEPVVPPVPTEPTLTVSKTDALDASGETVTVSGAGYDPSIPMYLIICRDVPIGDVNFTFASGCTAGAKQITNTPSTPTMVKLENDGSFTTTFTVARKAAFTSGSAIYTVANHLNMNNRSQDVKQAVSFSPLLTVTPTTGLNPEGETVTVSGLGYDPAVPMYLLVCRDVPLASVDFAFAMPCTAGSKVITGTPTRPTQVTLESDGTFSTTLTVKNSAALTGGAAIYTLADHTNQSNRSQDARRAISFTGPVATSITLASDPQGGVEGTTFTIDSTVSPAVAGSVRFSVGDTELGTATVDDSGKATVSVSSLRAGTSTVKAAFTPASPLLHAASESTLDIVVSPKKVAAGSLSWGVKDAFRAYVVGPVARGSIVGSGVGVSGSSFVFGQASGGTYTVDRGTGTSHYSGSVRFTGHGGALDLRLSNPVVRVDSANSGTLLLSVNGGSAVPFASLALASGTKRVADGAVSYGSVPATLTAQGAAAFVNGDSQFYPAGTVLDPLSFIIGSPSAASGGSYTAAAFVAITNAIPPTPPATTGITLESAEDGVEEGGEVTVTAEGFESNEQGIKVVIYSEPTTLDTNARADAQGVVSWTGRLPTGLTGKHTLTFQGSVDRGIVLDIQAKPTTRSVGCLVDDAEISWGFNEAFRSYISGAIANGEWIVADGASYETPNFGWSAGEGNYDGVSGEGLLAFLGSVQFTGHSGVLNTTIANPQLRFDDRDTATLLLDVTGTTQAGEQVSQQGVEFVTIDLAAAEATVAGDIHSFAAAPTVLTSAGAAAFGTYEAGTAFDPITVSFSDSSGCATPTAEQVEAEASGAVDTAPNLGWLLWFGAALLLVAAAVTAWVVIARRRGNA